MTVLRLAEDLASAGVPVFFCRSDKRPACPHGFKDAALDLAEVRALLRHYPGPLIGVPTGAASGFDVLDVDPRHGGHHWWLKNKHRIPDTRMHRTGGGGLHVLFLHDERVRNSESKIAPVSILGAQEDTAFGGPQPAARCRRRPLRRGQVAAAREKAAQVLPGSNHAARLLAAARMRS